MHLRVGRVGSVELWRKFRAGRVKWTIVGRALAALGTFLSVCTAAVTTFDASAGAATALPSPGHLIVGPLITLPPALYEANEPGSPALITQSQAMTVESTMWQLWEAAMVQSDTRALSQLIAPGPMLEGTINNCGFPSGACVYETTPRADDAIQVSVPMQKSYPLDFLAQVRTTQYVSTSDSVSQWELWVEVQILTKSSAASPWQLSFDTGFDAADGSLPSLLPLGFQTVTEPNGEYGLYNPKPFTPFPVSSSKFLPLLASYWQSFKNTGHGPARSPFLAGGYAAGQGQQFAMDRQGELYAGSRQYFSFSADPSAGSWTFSASGGYPFVCGSVLDTSTNAAAPNDLNQNSDESNFGVPLPPGRYRKITSLTEHQACVYVVQNGRIDEVGNQSYTSEVIGEGKPSGSIRADTVRTDLETGYGVLAYELLQYTKHIANCKVPSAACFKSSAGEIADQFNTFSSYLTGLRYPSVAVSDANALELTTDSLVKLFSGIAKNPRPDTSLATIQGDVITLNEQFDTLIADLTPQVA